MTTTDQTRIEQIANNWENFKQQNDERLKQIQKNNAADPITIHQLSKLNKAIDNYQNVVMNRGTQYQTANYRPMSAESCHAVQYLSGSSQNKYQQAFCNYIRKGVENEISDQCQDNLNACNIGSQQDCGYIVTSRMNDYIGDMIAQISPMRTIANVIEISGDIFDLVGCDKNSITAGWSEDTIAYTDSEKPLNIIKKSISTYQLYAQPKATQKLVDDPRIDIEIWLSDALIEVFATQENNAFINGDGVGKPKGILSACNDRNSINAQRRNNEQNKNINAQYNQLYITDDDIIRLFYSLPHNHTHNAKFLLGYDALQNIRMLKEKNSGRYIWQPDFSSKGMNTILGCEIVVSSDMPKVSDITPSVVFGDFKKAYQIVDRHGIRILRDPFTNKPFIKFFATKTVGGGVIDDNAIRFLKTSTV